VTALRSAIAEQDVDLAYSDADRLDRAGRRTEPFFKPDWSPELLYSCDLLTGVTAFDPSLLDSGLDLSSAGPAWRRAVGLEIGHKCRQPRHIPHVLSHTPLPAQDGTSGYEGEALRRCVSAHLNRQKRVCPVVELGPGGWPIVRWQTRTERLVSVVIPSRDKVELLGPCLEGLLARTTYEPLEIIVVDNASVEDSTKALYRHLSHEARFRLVTHDGPFNFSAACNHGARAARGDLLLFLNNDTEVLHPDWLEQLVQWFEVDGIGAVGSKLLFPDGTLQHAGVIVGMGGIAGHLFHGEHEHYWSLFGSDDWYRNLSAVTGACVLVSREAFDSVGGFDEAYRLAYGDVDLCIRLRNSGWRILYTPHARLLHHESRTRGKRVPRRDFEMIASRLEMSGLLNGDPFYNPNLSYASLRPTFCEGSHDLPRQLFLNLMKRLPPKETILLPDDLR
jgi:GT2 family glycosyltransferase